MSRKTILLIEDDRAIRETTRQALEMEGYNVVVAEHGKEGLDILENLTRCKTPPDSILLDLMMPVMNGWEFLDALHASPNVAKPPVIITSAVKSESGHERAAAFLQKPIELDELLSVLVKHAG